MTSARRHAWIDATAGIAGDMLLAALIDAGAGLDAVRSAVDAVVPGAVGLERTTVTRAGQRATRITVEVLTGDRTDRRWRSVRDLLGAAALADPVRRRALAVFAALADAEADVHGVPADSVHFHEVGALDSIADITGVCAALDDLGIDTVSASPVALGAGRVRTAHGELPVPVPAVLRLARGWRVAAGGTGELTTPTGMALLAALATACEDLPALVVDRTGVGAGTADTPGRPNVTRVVIGEPDPGAGGGGGGGGGGQAMLLLETNVDDLDPRLWPGVLARLLRAGAADAWLVPIVMKKGRPAHTLAVLARPDQAAALRTVVLAETGTLGIRETALHRSALPRSWVDVPVPGGGVRIKIAHRDRVIVGANPEFDDVGALAEAQGRATRLVLDEARAAATAAGLVVGAPVPPEARSTPTPGRPPPPGVDEAAGA